ncbi:MAG TPA: undecaprenyldiphospho-muramoylpentapeptide beta-N-acetylglucosaminyltransferase [Candidatus Competibacteraceae bacterium]|nr:undecaprenyldiphospho-muramoylpentapeptide beta-N-acetylglucosaminyltransferase [Candidatus Competibacteraceae bacterium]
MNAAPVVIMAGGTGGHIFPGLAVAEALRRRQVPVVWLGTPQGLEAQLVPPSGIPIEWIRVRGLRGSALSQRIKAPFMLAAALCQAGLILRRLRPRLVLGMGGFASGPGGMMARLLGIPLVVHEQNAVPGMTNRVLARLAARVLQAFPDSFPARCRALTVGNPVRDSIAALPPPAQRFQGRGGRPRLLVLGGSQGALALNQLLPQALARLPVPARPEVWHQAGGAMLESTQAAYREAGVEARLLPFIDDMAAAYGWADLVVCRAGALTVAELAAAGIGALLVPFPFAVDDHQTANAGYLARAGAAEILPQDGLDAAQLAARLGALLDDRTRLLAMAEAARSLAQSEAAERVAQHCLELARP